MAAGAAAAAVPMVAAFVFKGAIDETQKIGAEIFKLQSITGESAQGASALRAELEHFGVGADAGAAALGRLENNIAKNSTTMEDGSVATKGLADKLNELGVKTADTTGKILPMDQLLPSLADKFQSMPDGAEKTSLAIQGFGRAGAALIPFLNEGSAGMADITAKAKEMGLILDQSTVNAIRANALAAKDMDEAMKGLQLQIGTAVIPVLTDLTKKFTEVITSMNAHDAQAKETNKTWLEFVVTGDKSKVTLNTLQEASKALDLEAAALKDHLSLQGEAQKQLNEDIKAALGPDRRSNEGPQGSRCRHHEGR